MAQDHPVLKILTWYWKQTPPRVDYDAEKVNRWAAQWRSNLTIPYTLACVTDHPDGIDSDIEIIEPPRDFEAVEIRQWSVASGMPQCYRRLSMFRRDAAEIFGAEWFVCSDIDLIIVANVDDLFDPSIDFRMFGGTSSKRPYNGSMVQMRGGARPQVYDQFAADPVGVATSSRARYIGSDQAVISAILGPGERTWSVRDGVYAWSPKLRRQMRSTRPGYGNAMPKLRMMFFPGFDNPWEAHKFRGAFDWIYNAWAHSVPPPANRTQAALAIRERKRRECLWAYDDPKQWGREFQRAARSRSNQRVRLFIRPDRPPPDGRAFVRLDQQGKQRDVSRNMVLELANRGCITLPTPREALLYDDKVAQAIALRPYLPPTLVLEDAARARAVAMAARNGIGGLEYPFVSKSAEGAASANVRVIGSPQEAEAEVRRVFEGPGIDITYGRRQRGYVYWQRLVPGQLRDIRICTVGPYWYGLIRYVRPGTIKASGSGLIDPITENRLDQDDEVRAAAALALDISAAIGTQWMAYDFVFEGGRPYCLEMSSAWTMKAYRDCPMFDDENRRTTRTGAHSFRIAVDVLREMPSASPSIDTGNRRDRSIGAR